MQSTPARSKEPTSKANRLASTIAVAAVMAATVLAAACGADDAAADPARFCEINRELLQLDDITTASPTDARDLATRTRALLAEAEDTSPTDIRSEVRATADSYRDLLDFYTDADFDVPLADFEAALDAGEIGADPPEASDVITWIDNNCS